MKRTILSIAYPFSPVCEETAGGAEQILLTLDKAIIEKGWQSIVVAAKGSKINGKLIEVPITKKLITKEYRSEIYTFIKSKILNLLSSEKISLLHFHGIDFTEYIPFTSIPIVVTLHLPFKWYSNSIIQISKLFKNIRFICVSNAQFNEVKKCIDNINLICNGVESSPNLNPTRTKDYCCIISRICPEKGIHHAIDAAEKIQIPLILAGEVYPYKEHIEYFEIFIQPRINNVQFKYIGNVDRKSKDTLLNNAACTLITSTVAETSSLVAMESIIRGTPVAGLYYESLGEIVEQGITGYLASSVEELPDAITKAISIDTLKFMSNVIEKFHNVRMIHEYFELYEQLF